MFSGRRDRNGGVHWVVMSNRQLIYKCPSGITLHAMRLYIVNEFLSRVEIARHIHFFKIIKLPQDSKMSKTMI